MKSNKEGPGECAQSLAEERKLYDARIQWHRSSGAKFPPLSEGALIVDEVKVAAKMHWNSCDDSLVGHSLTADEMATLHDLYVSLSKIQKYPRLTTFFRHFGGTTRQSIHKYRGLQIKNFACLCYECSEAI